MSQIALFSLACLIIFVAMGPCCADVGPVRTRHQQCIDRKYDVACSFAHSPKLDIFQCKYLGCGKYIEDLKLYRYFSLDRVDEGTMCGKMRICKGRKCVPVPKNQALQYVGLVDYSNCVRIDEIKNATGI